jgi:hypothetical protein
MVKQSQDSLATYVLSMNLLLGKHIHGGVDNDLHEAID